MQAALHFALEIVSLTLGYAAVDGCIRRDGFVKSLRRFGLSKNGMVASWILLCAMALLGVSLSHGSHGSLGSPGWAWQSLPQGEVLRFLSTFLVAFLAWQAITKDIDPVTGENHRLARWLLLSATCGLYFHPVFLGMAGFLLTMPFGLWQHHATLPMRLVQALMAHLALVILIAPWANALLPGSYRLFGDTSTLFFFLMTVIISHYFITALAKGMLGPKWYSWPKDNRLHFIAASAYSWGWARFVPWEKWIRVIRGVRRIEKPLQWLAFGLEALSPLALLHPALAIGFCLAWAGFHLGVFTLSGLLFWDWILTDIAMAMAIALLPQEVTDQIFGPMAVMASLLFMVLFPLRHKLWKPMPLGWFDTPLTQRIHWRVRGESGRVYGLYNDFMCPHERLYGKVNGCFLAPHPVITYHLGEVWKPDLRDAIVAAGPDLARLEEVRQRFGISPRCEKRAANHQAYLRRFFRELNGGARKHVLPRPWRWLKAPGDQLFYWGDLPPYRGQRPGLKAAWDKAVSVSLHYREEYFDGEALRLLREEEVLAFAVDPESDGSGDMPVREATPKEIDDFLLSHAAGRLIDLPGYKKGYLRGDDGKPPEETGRPQGKKRDRSAGVGMRQASSLPNQR